MFLSFDAHGIPAPQGSKRVVRGHLIDANAPRLRPWRSQMTEAAITAKVKTGHPAPTTEAVQVVATFRFNRPRSHYGTGRNRDVVKDTAPKFVAVRPDVDKLARALLDAFTGVVWRDDAQVVSLVVVKEYTEDAAGVSVVVSDLIPPWA